MNTISDASYQPLTKDSINNLPATTGIYVFKTGDSIYYVGKSTNIRARVKSHVENAKVDPKERAIIEASKEIGYTVADSEFAALILESELIRRHKPKYNSRWRDDKSFIYIKVTKGTYPKIYPVRQENDGKSLYFGPFSSQRNVLEILRYIRTIFPYCAQKKIGSRPCFYSKIGLCNPCPNEVEKNKDDPLKKKQKQAYRQNIRNIVKVLRGNTDLVLKALYQKLKILSKEEQFEQAIIMRNQIYEFEQLIHLRSFSHNTSSNYNRSTESVEHLLIILKPFFPKLDKLHRIECYDISNLGGKDSTSSMVVFSDGLIDKTRYRKFKIKNLRLTSDFEMLAETLERRFNHKTWEGPDLIVIDGGKPQLAVIKEVLKKRSIKIPFIGIAKHPDRLVIGVEKFPTIRPAFHNLGFSMIRYIRDESHRFARKYHRYLRNKHLLPL